MKPSTTIEKVCHVLSAFSPRHSMGLTEIAAATGLLKSDVHRILKSLEQFGFVEQDAGTRRYHLGLELLRLGHLVYDRLHLNEVARPFLLRLAQAAEAGSNLAILDSVNEAVVFVEQVDSPNAVQIRWRIGRRVEAHATAVGKTLLAYLEAEAARKIYGKSGLKRKTRFTITDPPAFELELARIREAGYAVDREEAVLGACCVAAPVCDHRNQVVAAISVSMLAAGFGGSRENEVTAMVRSFAAQISAALGHMANPASILTRRGTYSSAP